MQLEKVQQFLSKEYENWSFRLDVQHLGVKTENTSRELLPKLN